VSDEPTLLYLEADDEITAVVRRVRDAAPGRVIIVAPGRSRATSSAVALRLLAREDREIVVVGDALTRSLAVEAGLASYANVDDARRAAPGDQPPAEEPHQATISIVRGGSDDTPPALPLATPTTSAAGDGRDAETRPVPVIREPPTPAVPTERRAPGPRTRRRPGARPARRASALGIGLLLAALAGVGVSGAALLPSAVIEITPAGVEVGPRTYEITMDAERRSGTAEATATVTATGTYTTQTAASGTVVLYNWTFFPVAVPAGTFVAAGEQAFATQADVVVPRGRLTGAGTILAGDVEVAVLAAAVGPAANVEAGTIDTVVNEAIDLRLGGVPENPERRVDNPAPTAGGVDATGPEITQADVDAAVAALREQLDAQVADALPGEDPALLAVRPEPAEAVIDGLDGLSGTRDQATAEIAGSLAWEVVVAERDLAITDAEAALLDDPDAVPTDHVLVADSIRVSLGEPRLDGTALTVPAEVTATAVPAIDERAVRDRVAGLTGEEARAALADIGTTEVTFWPGWVGTVPALDWRVEVRVLGGDADPTIEPSPSVTTSP